MRYAQEMGGQKLHLVEELDPATHGGRVVAYTALCGRRPHTRGEWRMTCNLPLAHACGRCVRVWNARTAAPASERAP